MNFNNQESQELCNLLEQTFNLKNETKFDITMRKHNRSSQKNSENPLKSPLQLNKKKTTKVPKHNPTTIKFEIQGQIEK